MAKRLTESQWELARAEYESQKKSCRDIAKEYAVSASTITRRAQKEGWQTAKTQHIVDKKTNAFKSLHEVQQQLRNTNATQQAVIDGLVSERLAKEKIFVDSAMANQEIANQFLANVERMQELKDHAELTRKNKETVFGKQPETQVNIGQEVPKVVEYVIVND